MVIFNNISRYIVSTRIRIRNYFKNIKKENLREFFREQIFQTQDSNLKIATAIGFGVFMGIVPIWGFQTIAAIFIATFFRLNKAIVFLATNISFPPIIPIILYISFLTGGFILNQKTHISFDTDFDFVNIQNGLLQYYVGAVVFAIIAGSLFGIISHFLLFLFRKDKI